LKTFNEIIQCPEFKKDIKKLSKRFRSLPEDLATFIRFQLNSYHNLGIDNGGIFRIPGLPFIIPSVYKAKKFACKALKGRGAQSGIRIIYAHFESENRIDLIEIYFKGDKENENKERIARMYPQRSS
jgi:mRNA-degrading endonuclease RelE of RelBE toxin-antitoxin system